jgi:hypothetical protein
MVNNTGILSTLSNTVPITTTSALYYSQWIQNTPYYYSGTSSPYIYPNTNPNNTFPNTITYGNWSNTCFAFTEEELKKIVDICRNNNLALLNIHSDNEGIRKICEMVMKRIIDEKEQEERLKKDRKE